MCNINLVMNKRRLITAEPSNYMNVASAMSWQGNNHGEGCLGFRNKGVVIRKSISKLIYRQKYWLLATHQRLATSGKRDKENAHPFVTKDFVLMHNGIFSGLGGKDKSDTHAYAKMLQEEFDRCGNLLKALRKIHNKLSGFYSVVLWHKRTGKVYYYKNSSASIYGAENSEWLVLSTKQENVDYAKLFFGLKSDLVVEPHFLYEVTEGLRMVGKFERNDYQTNWKRQPKTGLSRSTSKDSEEDFDWRRYYSYDWGGN